MTAALLLTNSNQFFCLLSLLPSEDHRMVVAGKHSFLLLDVLPLNPLKGSFSLHKANSQVCVFSLFAFHNALESTLPPSIVVTRMKHTALSSAVLSKLLLSAERFRIESLFE